ncbi:MAG: PorT family protein [Muribaculaceae bacterium]|nr:PorT family protein [Muribaculaceae bacterium]
MKSSSVIKKYSTFFSKALRLVVLLITVGTSSYAYAKWGEKVPNRQYADMKRWHWGFSVGTHVQDLSFTHSGLMTEDGRQWQMEVPDFSPGFNATVLGDLCLHKYLNLRLSPGMYFGSKTVHMLDFNSGEKQLQDIKSALVVIPLDLKISGDRLHNTRPYVTAGIMGVLDISKKRSDPIVTNNFDTMLTVGLGCDFYLPFFKLCPEIKFCFGLSDILKHDRPDLDENPSALQITQSLTKMKSNMVVLSFYFE